MISDGSGDVSAPDPFPIAILKEKPGGSNLDKHSLSAGNLSAEASPLALQCRGGLYSSFPKAYLHSLLSRFLA